MSSRQLPSQETAFAALDSPAVLAAVLEASPEPILVVAADGRIVLAGGGVERLFGYERGELLGAPLERLVPEAFRCLHQEHREAFMAGAASRGEGPRGELPARRRNGTVFPVEVRLSSAATSHGELVVAAIRDASERREAERMNAARVEELREAQRMAAVGSWGWNRTDDTAAWSEEMYRIFGRNPADGPPPRDAFLAYVHPDDRERVVLRLREAGEGGEVFELDCRVVRADGSERELRVRGRADPGQRGTYGGTVQDVTERLSTERELRQAREYAEAIVAAMHEGYGLTIDGRITTVNDALCRLTGFTREELIGCTPPYPFWPPDWIERGQGAVGKVRSDDGGTLEMELMRKDGTRFMAEITAYPARNADGSRLGFVNTFRDISERKRYEAELERLASEDPLTGLANQRVFQQQLAAETARALRHRRPLSVAVLDVDHFKDVNDRYGHVIGDEVLREVATRLGGLVREGELLARVGGEEFAWILPDADGAGAFAAAERARYALGAAPIPPVGTLTLSAGVCDLAATGEPSELFGCADEALYQAKRTGRNRTVRYP